MMHATRGYRVAVMGADSLLGKELLVVLKERQFPVSRLVTPATFDDAEPELPVLDLSDGIEPVVIDVKEAGLGEADLDFVFVASPLPAPAKKAGAPNDAATFLRSARRLAASSPCHVIDLSEGLAEETGGVLSVPFLGRDDPPTGGRSAGAVSGFYISPHPASIVISTVLLRLAARFPIKNVVAQVFGPVSEIGSKAIEELQKQTLNLLTFQKIPQSVFGAQLAFNLLPRFGRSHSGQVIDLEGRVQKQLRNYLGRRAPLPALRVIYGPVFHALACSLYVELEQAATPEALTQVLAGAPVRVRKASEKPPTQVEVAGSSEIVLDALAADAGNPAGIWIWAAVDNLRLAAVNAVEIAETLHAQKRTHIQ